MWFLLMPLTLSLGSTFAQTSAATGTWYKVEMIAQGMELRDGTNGIIFDAQDRLYTARVGNNFIIVMDLKSGKILNVLGLELGVIQPDMPPALNYNGVTAGPSDNIYVTGDVTNVLQRISPNS